MAPTDVAVWRKHFLQTDQVADRKSEERFRVQGGQGPLRRNAGTERRRAGDDDPRSTSGNKHPPEAGEREMGIEHPERAEGITLGTDTKRTSTILTIAYRPAGHGS